MGALEGLKILDFSSLLPGPYATLYLADLGADVLRIVNRSRPGLDTYSPPLVEGVGASAGISANNAFLGRNKRSISLDTKTPGALEVIYRLVKEYDIVVDQFRPGVMDRMGIGYEALKKINPRVIFCALTGYGQDGPSKESAGHDINYLARSGLMSYSGRENIGPVLSGLQIADTCSGSMNTIIGILAAVIYRNRTGEGQYVDVSMLDGMLSFLGPTGGSYLLNVDQNKEVLPGYEDGLLNGGSLYDFYETKDGRYISVGPVEPKFFNIFCEGIGRPDLSAGMIMPKQKEVKDQVKQIIKTKTLTEWIEIFKDTDACVEPVKNMHEALFEDEQVKSRNMLVNVPVINGNGKTLTQLANPLKLSKCPPVYKFAGCTPGFHTEQVMAELGFTEAEIENFKGGGVFG